MPPAKPPSTPPPSWAFAAWRGRSTLPGCGGCGWPPRSDLAGRSDAGSNAASVRPRPDAGSRRHSNLRGGSSPPSSGPSVTASRADRRSGSSSGSGERDRSRFGERERSSARFGEWGRRSRSSACFGERGPFTLRIGRTHWASRHLLLRQVGPQQKS